MKVTSKQAYVRLWLSVHGVWFVGAAAVLIAVGLASIFMPIGPTLDTTGILETVQFVETKQGSIPTAIVRLSDGRMARVTVLVNHTCVVGRPMRTRSTRMIWGWRDTLAPGGCTPAP